MTTEVVIYLILTLTSGLETKLELDRTQPSMEECEKNIPIFESYIAQKGYATLTDVNAADVAKTSIICVTEEVPAESAK